MKLALSPWQSYIERLEQQPVEVINLVRSTGRASILQVEAVMAAFSEIYPREPWPGVVAACQMMVDEVRLMRGGTQGP